MTPTMENSPSIHYIHNTNTTTVEEDNQPTPAQQSSLTRSLSLNIHNNLQNLQNANLSRSNSNSNSLNNHQTLNTIENQEWSTYTSNILNNNYEMQNSIFYETPKNYLHDTQKNTPKNNNLIAILSKKTNKKVENLLNEINKFNMHNDAKINSVKIFENFFHTLKERKDYDVFAASIKDDKLQDDIQKLFQKLYKEINPKRSIHFKSHCDKIIEGAKLKIERDQEFLSDNYFIRCLLTTFPTDTAQSKINDYIKQNYMGKGSESFHQLLSDNLLKAEIKYQKVINECYRTNMKRSSYKAAYKKVKKLAAIDPFYSSGIDKLSEDTKKALLFFKKKSSLKSQVINFASNAKDEKIDTNTIDGLKNKLSFIKYLQEQIAQIKNEQGRSNGVFPSMLEIYRNISERDDFIEKTNAIKYRITDADGIETKINYEQLNANEAQITANQAQSFAIDIQNNNLQHTYENMNNLLPIQAQLFAAEAQNNATVLNNQAISNSVYQINNYQKTNHKFLMFEILTNIGKLK